MHYYLMIACICGSRQVIDNLVSAHIAPSLAVKLQTQIIQTHSTHEVQLCGPEECNKQLLSEKQLARSDDHDGHDQMDLWVGVGGATLMESSDPSSTLRLPQWHNTCAVHAAYL